MRACLSRGIGRKRCREKTGREGEDRDGVRSYRLSDAARANSL